MTTLATMQWSVGFKRHYRDRRGKSAPLKVNGVVSRNRLWPNTGRVHLVHEFGRMSVTGMQSRRRTCGCCGARVAECPGCPGAAEVAPDALIGYHYWRPREDGTPTYSVTAIHRVKGDRKPTRFRGMPTVYVDSHDCEGLLRSTYINVLSRPALWFITSLVDVYYEPE